MSLATRTFRALLPSTFAASLFISTLSVADALRAAESTPRDLTGSWNLNTEHSQVASRDGLDDGTRPTGRFGGGINSGGMGGSRPGGGPMGGAMGGGVDPQRLRRARDTMRELMDSPVHLTITHDQGAVLLETPDGARERIVADGKKHPHALETGDVTNRAQWRDGVLRVETTTKDGVKIERRFALDGEGARGRLVITYIANLPMARRPLEVKKVYDRADE
jgi:hypothetical protein